MSKARFPIGQMTTSYDGCCGVLFRERKGDVYCINSSLQSIIFCGRVSPAAPSLISPRILGIKRPPPRFSAGAPGEKTRGLWDCGIVGLWRNRDFWNFRIFHVFPYLKNGQNFTFPPLWFLLDSRPLRFSAGAPGEKLGDCGIVGLWRNRDFWNFRIFHGFPYLKNDQTFTFQRCPLWFCARNPDFLISGAKPKGGDLWKVKFWSFFK